jgi:hypothetical protein
MIKVFLTFLLIFISHICSAPNLDYRLGVINYSSLYDILDREYHESEFSKFINDLGLRESGNNWLCINQIGCFGEWQFDESTLQFLGFRKITLKKFMKNPEIFPRELQLKALKTLIKVNLMILLDYEHFIGESIDGVVITKSGMIAASHLGGAGSLEKFLNSRGRVNKRDVLGTSIYDYLKKFSYYDLD